MSGIAQLENLRNRLLDLTNRNRLLNFKHTKSSSIRIIDELPDQLAETLLADKKMTFIAVLDPTEEELIEAGYLKYDDESGELIELKEYPSAKEWAEYLQLDVRFEVPFSAIDTNEIPERHSDLNIQTLFFPGEMDMRLNKIRLTSQSAIQEMGANILYLVFGFLEWYESEESDQKKLAPLYLMPVKLERKLERHLGRYVFTLKYSGEDILPNILLKEKLKRYFGVDIPDLHDEIFPESYMKIIEEWLAEDGMRGNLARWKVRRYITLGLLNFSKQLMYLDLDPERWEGEKSLLDHDVIKKFLGVYEKSQDESDDGGILFEEYDIDRVENIWNNYPIIEDADSSQHSAIIDVLKGKDLIIQGPPGTGKSQTITNLIAAALSQKRKILFVAEKMAALEVVKRRLDKVGLGDFCLELHSHKTQKKKVLDEIRRRLDKHGMYRHPNEIDRDIARYEDLKRRLRDYADLINSVWKNTGLTRHKILMAATRYRKSVPLHPGDLHPDSYNGDNFDINLQNRLEEELERYVNVFEKINEQVDDAIQSHPWFGVENDKLQIFDTPKILEVLHEWNDTIKALTELLEEMVRHFDMSDPNFVTDRKVLSALIDDIEKIPSINEYTKLEYLPHLRNNDLTRATKTLELYISIQETFVSLSTELTTEELITLDRVEQYREGVAYLKDQFKSPVQMFHIAQLLQDLNVIEERLHNISDELEKIEKSFGVDNGYFSFSYEGLKRHAILLNALGILGSRLIDKRDRIFDNDVLDEILPRLTQDISQLKKMREDLEHYFDLIDIPDELEILRLKEVMDNGGFFKWIKSEWRQTRAKILSFSHDKNVSISILTEKLEELAKYSQKKEQLCSDATYKELLKEHFFCIDTDIEEISELREWYKFVRNTYGRGFGKDAMVAEKLFSLKAEYFEEMQYTIQRGLKAEVESIIERLDDCRKHFNGATEIQKNSVSLMGENGLIRKLIGNLSKAINQCQPLVSHDNWSIVKLQTSIDDLQGLKEKIEAFESEQIFDEIFGIDYHLQPGLETELEQKERFEILKETINFANFVENELSVDAIKNILYTHPEDGTITFMKNSLQKLHVLHADEERFFKDFASITRLDKEKWFHKTEYQFKKVLEKNQKAMNEADWLNTWLDYLREKRVLSDSGLTPIVEKVEKGDLESSEAIQAFRSGIFDLLAREIFEEDETIATFSGMTQESIQSKFKEYDEKIKKLQSEKIAWQADQVEIPLGHGGGRVGNFTELTLLQHQTRLQRRQIPIRQLVDRSSHALTAIKPCFMMSPMSVSQYLKPGTIKFDLVIMDEASQIKPEDALGAIARGAQIVIVGDPKQLPPTNFFNRVDDNEGDDVSLLEESESILDATAIMFPTRQLRWHYRSRHESLIAFSNKEFYDGKLIIFPSPYNENEEFGIKYHRIQNGFFVNRKNIEEARIIAQAVKKHLIERPAESLGVVAMNVEQRIQIESEVDALVRDDPILQNAYEKNFASDEPFFIKNLENVQGDERDVIFISMTYGRNAPGMRVFQRFGPINSDLGWRRLNVLFTRSKKRMHIFSSMGSDDIVVSPESKRGVKALHGMLKYCETGVLHATLSAPEYRDPDSDFEIAVMEELSRYGFECVPQVGVAGFYIDIGVKDPGNPGKYLMGIECDGATYHSAKSTRDRDKLRQEILERLGWRIRRIWSTDWFKNPEGTIKPIVDELNRLKSVSTDFPKNETIVEEQEFKEIIEEVENDEREVLEEIGNSKSLKEVLVDFNRDVIKMKYPNTPRHKRFLKPKMIEALVEFRPTTREEFLARIPGYLRGSVDVSEAEFIEEILEILNMYDDDFD